MDSNKDTTRIAPFTDEEVRILDLWQKNDYLHPYTCCDHKPMTATSEGLKCDDCGKLQEWVHDFSLRESAATYNPIKIVDGKPRFKRENDE
jgi:hypothetical protein